MSETTEPKASELIPSDSLMFPSALTSGERRDLRKAVDSVIQKIGIERQLQESIDANVKEFEATLSLILAEIRSDLQLSYLNLIGELTRTIQNEHLNFISEVDSGFRELISEVQELQGELMAWEKLEEHRQELNRAHEERQRELLKANERAAKELIASVRQLQFDIDPERKALIDKIQAMADENAKLKLAISQAFRLAQDIGLLGLRSKKRNLLRVLGECLK